MVAKFPEQLLLSGQTHRFVKGAYSSSKSLKQGSRRHSPPEAIELFYF